MTTKILSISPVTKAARPLPDHKQDWSWINEHLDELRGQWVVMRRGEFVAADPNIRQLVDKLSQDAYPDAMVTYVPTEDESRRVVL